MLAPGRPLVALVMTDPPLEAVQLVMVITPLLIGVIKLGLRRGEVAPGFSRGQADRRRRDSRNAVRGGQSASRPALRRGYGGASQGGGNVSALML
jgi:hypothetical protein